MKPVLHSISYAGLWGQDSLGLEEFIPHAAKLGYSGVMLAIKRPHLSPLDTNEKQLDRLAALLEENRLTAACMAAYSDPNAGFTATSGPFAPLPETQLLYVKHCAMMASQLKSPLIRLLTSLATTGETYYAQWSRSVKFMREACDIAEAYSVKIGIQNHDDIGGHYLSMGDFIEEIDHPNCYACFDAWSVAQHGDDLAEAVRYMGSRIVHTTVADYVKRPRFHYHHPGNGNVYERALDEIRAVPPGEGFIDYPTFFNALKEIGFDGTVAFEMCSPIRGGGGMENLDRYAQRFLKFLEPWAG